MFNSYSGRTERKSEASLRHVSQFPLLSSCRLQSPSFEKQAVRLFHKDGDLNLIQSQPPLRHLLGFDHSSKFRASWESTRDQGSAL